ncbi:MAG TPA: FAD binding domain-containing protein [Anaerolineales bacterium]|jgi:carbon-monoxide dehydrogenase medium subunit
MWRNYYNANSIEEVLQLLAEGGGRARIIAGGTDLILEIEREVRTGIETLIDVTRIPNLDHIVLDEDDVIHLGPLVTHSHCVASELIVEKALPLAQAAIEVGAPQIRNRGTIAGNLITASPANDTITPLMALGAKVRLLSQNGERVLSLEELYTGVRQTAMRPDELMVDIFFPAMTENQAGIFIKFGLRRAQAISIVHVSVVLSFDGASDSPVDERLINKAAITLGAVAPTIIHAGEAEEFLQGRTLDEETREQASRLAVESASPIDDVRSSRDYRREMVRVAVLRGLRAIRKGETRVDYPSRPVLLWGQNYQGRAPELVASAWTNQGSPIVTRINGQEYRVASGHHKTLLRFLREDLGLIGTKEGCAEGECGACTIFLDGMAVMSCLVPAERAHGAEIVTIEGLASNGELHPVQQAFISEGAVQCGYCTPGLIMSAAKLLEELPHPRQEEIEQAITGNLCRCTGYYKIVKAIELASQMEVENE